VLRWAKKVDQMRKVRGATGYITSGAVLATLDYFLNAYAATGWRAEHPIRATANMVGCMVVAFGVSWALGAFSARTDRPPPAK
jgi:hypothetical protein